MSEYYDGLADGVDALRPGGQTSEEIKDKLQNLFSGFRHTPHFAFSRHHNYIYDGDVRGPLSRAYRQMNVNLLKRIEELVLALARKSAEEANMKLSRR